MLQDPCSTPLMKPRERVGQDSIASAAPAGHSAPMPIPSAARKRKSSQKLGARPAARLQIEYQRIEIISGVLRPTRSASHPEAVAPTRRSQRVTVKTAVTSTKLTPKVCAIGTMISRNIVKSKASRVQPSQAATQAIHWSLVGSFHQGIWLTTAVDVAICESSWGSSRLFLLVFLMFARVPAIGLRTPSDGAVALVRCPALTPFALTAIKGDSPCRRTQYLPSPDVWKWAMIRSPK